MKKVHLGLMVIGMLAIGQINAQETTKDHPRHENGDFFAKMDVNKDGAITLDEMKAKDADQVKKEARFKRLDVNADGKITPEEVAVMQEKRQERIENRPSADEQFAKMDKNGDGGITLDELKSKEGDEAKKAERFKKMDANGDGKVTQEELVALREAQEAKREKHQNRKCDASKCQKPAEEAPKR
jgi:EF-hand domain pair/EF hand